MTLMIFSPATSPSEPPKMVKSCEYTATCAAVDGADAGDDGVAVRTLGFSMPNACVRWRTNSSSSTNEPGSSSSSMRSRAVILPLACCFSMAASPLAVTASW